MGLGITSPVERYLVWSRLARNVPNAFPDTKTIAFPSLPAIERSKTGSYWTSIYKQKTSGSENKGLHLFDDLYILSRTGIKTIKHQ